MTPHQPAAQHTATQDVNANELAALVRPLLANAVVAFDVDGVLAPLVTHADDSVLSPGVADNLATVAAFADVAILSGRSLGNLERVFSFPPTLTVIGSHGLETRGDDPIVLDSAEAATHEQLSILGTKAAEAAGEGAWVESKPASIVVHTRQADPQRAGAAIDAVTRLAGMVDGATVKPGHQIIEMLARRSSKGDALLALAAKHKRSPIVFLGDDVTDEDAFALMAEDDISVKVGPGKTAARYRLADPAEVAEFLAIFAEDH